MWRQGKQIYQNCLFNFKRRRFSKFLEHSLALLGLKIIPAVLKSLSQAAEAGSGVFSLRDRWHTDGNVYRMSMYQLDWPGRTLVAWCYRPVDPSAWLSKRSPPQTQERSRVTWLPSTTLLLQVGFDVVEAYGGYKTKWRNIISIKEKGM